jgi:cytidine deaminase
MPNPSLNRNRNPNLDRPRLLVAAALEARQRAVAPYSGFHVGAALLTASGRIFTGANVESASYGLTCCAERVALFNALTQGERAFAAIAIVAATDDGPMPCGACRQLLAEYAPDAAVWIANSRQPKRVRQFSVAQLLPKPFVLARGPAAGGAKLPKAAPSQKSR